MDWDKLKREYVTSNISYRKLAAKYNIPFNSLFHQASEYKWYDERKQFRDKINAKALKNAEKKAIDYKSVLYDLAYKVACQLSDITDKYDIETLAAKGVKPRDITGAIKDLGDALHIKSEADIKEQAARIKKLERETTVGSEDEEKYGVLILPSIEPIEKAEDIEHE